MPAGWEASPDMQKMRTDVRSIGSHFLLKKVHPFSARFEIPLHNMHRAVEKTGTPIPTLEIQDRKSRRPEGLRLKAFIGFDYSRVEKCLMVRTI